ncbi:MAG TPA: DUF2306 domain-containing protein [Gemmatimonadaceae bacterium]|nr:DUF2306 domain-containing protein [Gemmatimonadaceae bacterium]
MSPLGWVHTTFAVLAMLSGAVVLVRRKGTRAHRRLGWVYAASMFALNTTALLIYRLFGGFGPFHVAAIFSLATVAAGVVVAIRRSDRGWVERHYRFMTYSYVGLLAAAVSEVAVRVPGAVFWWAVLIASALVLIVGMLLVERKRATVLAPFARIPTAKAGPRAPERARSYECS